MVAFPVCSNVMGVEDAGSADEEGGGGDGNACIPFEDTLDEAGEKPCRAGTVGENGQLRHGTVGGAGCGRVRYVGGTCGCRATTMSAEWR